MKVLTNIATALLFLSIVPSCRAQIKNSKTENIKIYGNCDMCKTNIEKAGNLKKVAELDWNKDTKMAKIIYDTTKTSTTEILKRIALAGYDSNQFLAPDDVYANLPNCCKYERVNKTGLLSNEIIEINPTENQNSTVESAKEDSELALIFDNYFVLKEAFVKSDQPEATTSAKNLLLSINQVKMNKLTSEEHTVWMKVFSNLKANTEKISTSTNLEKQRNAFMDLSANMYDLLKVSKQETPTYYQHCPMYNDGKGSNWLSKGKAIQNPYYGSTMLTCGKTVETIE